MNDRTVNRLLAETLDVLTASVSTLQDELSTVLDLSRKLEMRVAVLRNRLLFMSNLCQDAKAKVTDKPPRENV